MKTLKNDSNRTNSFFKLAFAGVIAASAALTGCGASRSDSKAANASDAGRVLVEETANDLEVWVADELPAADVNVVDVYADGERYIVDPQCSKKQRVMLELGARLEVIKALRERAARAGMDGLMDIRCEGTHTSRAFRQECTAKAFVYQSSAVLMANRGQTVGSPDRAGEGAVRRAAFLLTAREEGNRIAVE